MEMTSLFSLRRLSQQAYLTGAYAVAMLIIDSASNCVYRVWVRLNGSQGDFFDWHFG